MTEHAHRHHHHHAPLPLSLIAQSAMVRAGWSLGVLVVLWVAIWWAVAKP